MKSAEVAHNLVTRTEVEVVGVGKLYLTADFLKVKGIKTALDCGGCSHVHENRRLNSAVNGCKLAAARAALFFDYFKHIICLSVYILNRQSDAKECPTALLL